MRIGWEIQTTNNPPRNTYFLWALESFYGNVRSHGGYDRGLATVVP
jgi:hypothetical protein